MTDREKLAETINDYFGCDAAYFDVDPLEMAQHLIANGVVVREKGEWENLYYNYDYEDFMRDCSICRKSHKYPSNFCPNCGADMRKGENDG